MKREGTKSFLDQMRTVKPSGKIGFVTFMHDVYLYICYVYIQSIFVCMFMFIYDLYLYICMLWRWFSCFIALLRLFTFVFLSNRNPKCKKLSWAINFITWRWFWWKWRCTSRFFQPAKPSLPKVLVISANQNQTKSNQIKSKVLVYNR